MGTENIYIVILGGFLAFVANVCYMLGGTEGFGKFWRRFIGAFVLALAASAVAILLHCWQWQYLLVLPCLILGFSLGYGGDTTIVKVLKRLCFAFGVLSSLGIMLWIHQFSFYSWIVFSSAFLVALASVILGVINPLNNARIEEYLVSQCLTLFVPFIAFVR